MGIKGVGGWVCALEVVVGATAEVCVSDVGRGVFNNSLKGV